MQQGPDFINNLASEVGGDVCIIKQMGLSKALFDQLLEKSYASLTDGQVVWAVMALAIFCCMMRHSLFNRCS